MATWSKKAFAPGRVHEWAALQDTFEKQYMVAFAAHWAPEKRAEMMLLQVDAEDGSDVLYMALPDGVRPPDGFELIDFKDIPPNPNLLVADQIGYDELFRC